MEQILLKAFSILETLILLAAANFGVSLPPEDNISAFIDELDSLSDGIGTVSFNQVGGGVYRLKSGITSSATSLVLTSFKMPVSENEFAMSDFGDIGYGTIEPGSTNNKEFVSFTGITQNSDGSATLTGLERGLNFVSDYTASTTLQKAHSGGSQFILSNSPVFFTQFHNLNQVATSTAFLNFSSTSPPRYDVNPTWGDTSIVGSTTLASKGYADDLAIAGAADANETTKGIVEIITQTEMASTTSTGSTGAVVVIGGNLATSTPDLSATNRPNNYVVVTEHEGWIDPDFLWGGIHVGTSTPFQGATVGVEQDGTTDIFAIADTGTTTPFFFIDAKGDIRIATTTSNDQFQVAIAGTTTVANLHMSGGGTAGDFLKVNAQGAVFQQGLRTDSGTIADDTGNTTGSATTTVTTSFTPRYVTLSITIMGNGGTDNVSAAGTLHAIDGFTHVAALAGIVAGNVDAVTAGEAMSAEGNDASNYCRARVTIGNFTATGFDVGYHSLQTGSGQTCDYTNARWTAVE